MKKPFQKINSDLFNKIDLETLSNIKGGVRSFSSSSYVAYSITFTKCVKNDDGTLKGCEDKDYDK